MIAILLSVLTIDITSHFIHTDDDRNFAKISRSSDQHALNQTDVHRQSFEMKLSQVVWSSQSDNQEPTYPRFRRKLDNRRRTLKGRLWSNGNINYAFDPIIGDHKRSAIEKAIEHWRENTCLKFRNSSRKDYILFEDGVVCRSSVGRQGGMQTIDLADGCENLGIGIKGGGGDNGYIVHEIGHSLGSWHEHSRLDRDKFVRINFDNIKEDDWYQYRVIESDEDYLAAQLTPYDYGSVMHYYVEGLSPKNKEIPTIETIDPNYMQTIGQRAGLSFLDIKRVNEAYCSDVCQNKLPCQNGGYTDPSTGGSKCHNCRCPEGLGGSLCANVQLSAGNCGAELKATAIWKTIPKSATNQDCNWLIKASPGQNVRLEISISGFDCGDGPCSNYVEVKYKIGFESTGARFCCHAPIDPIISTSNRMVVLYRAKVSGSSDFEARYIIEGSQGNDQLSVQTGLSSRETKNVPNTVIFEPVPVELSDEKLSWSQWTSWSKCSIYCGGCGKTHRSRKCLDNDAECLKNSYEEVSCNRNVCLGAASNGGRGWYCCRGYELREGVCQPISKV